VTGLLRSQDERQAAVSAARYAGFRLPNRPRLAPWIIAVDLGDSRLQLRSDQSSHTLTHPLLIETFRRIEKIIDGRHTVVEIAASAGPDVLPTTVIFVLKLLQGKGLLQPGFDESALDDGERARWLQQLNFLSQFVPDASSAQGMLAKARVGLVGSGELRPAISTAISSIGVGGVIELGEPSKWCAEACGELSNLDLIVACEASPAFDFFDSINRACLLNGTRWLRVCIFGKSAQLGPTILPNQTACYTCFDLRLRAHQPELDEYLAYRVQSGALGSRVAEAGTAPFLSVVAGQVALEAMRLLIGFAPPVTVGRFYEFSAVSPVAISHDVLRVPRCMSCGRKRKVAEAWDQSFAAMDIES
jgi:bacteriocin biosynthesis cyclodehydratase domain-containing protein